MAVGDRWRFAATQLMLKVLMMYIHTYIHTNVETEPTHIGIY